MKTLLAGWMLTLTIGSMIEAVPATGFDSWLWSVLAISAATGFVHLVKDKT